MSTNHFGTACREYRFLRERGYPETGALKLVCDHHRLSRAERNALFRGVVQRAFARPRRAKLADPSRVRGARLGVDWYNVMITVESYLRGQPAFLCDDGILRDSSAAHASYRRGPVSDRAIDSILAALSEIAPAAVDAFLDSPIAYSGLLAEELRGKLSSLGIPSVVELSHSADYPLKRYTGIVASSDSVIVDHAAHVFDLARFTLERGFGFTPPRLEELSIAAP